MNALKALNGFLGLLAGVLSAQQPSFTHVFPGWKDARIDPTGTYWVWSDESLRLFKADSLFLAQSFNNLGNIHSIDPSNPLKALVFFREQGTILWTDNSGAALAEAIALDRLGMEQAQAACTSYDNGFWLFLPNEMRLVRFNKQLQITIDLPNVHLLSGLAYINPVFMGEAGRHLFLMDATGEWLLFDIFGAFLKKQSGPPPGKLFQWHSGGIMYGSQETRWFVPLHAPVEKLAPPQYTNSGHGYWIEKNGKMLSFQGDSLSFYNLR